MQAPLMAFDGLRSHHDPQDVAHLRSTWRSLEASLLEASEASAGVRMVAMRIPRTTEPVVVGSYSRVVIPRSLPAR
jgi:hypothetical protein